MIEPTERQKGVLDYFRIRVASLRAQLQQAERDYAQEAQDIIAKNQNGYSPDANWSLGDDLNFHLVEEE
jgi:hypothetical protein